MINRWELTSEVKEKYTPIVREFLNKLDNMTIEKIEKADNSEFTLDLSDTELRPYTLLELMKTLGYGDEEFEDNGWELDFWIYISNNEAKSQLTEELCIRGCGMTFELNLSHIEFV